MDVLRRLCIERELTRTMVASLLMASGKRVRRRRLYRLDMVKALGGLLLETKPVFVCEFRNLPGLEGL